MELPKVALWDTAPSFTSGSLPMGKLFLAPQGGMHGCSAGCHRRLPGCWFPGCPIIARGLGCCGGEDRPGFPSTGLAGGGRVNGRPIGCQAMCEKIKKPAGQESLSQIPWQELGMRSLSPLHHLLRLSPGWGGGGLGSWCHVAAGQGG